MKMTSKEEILIELCKENGIDGFGSMTINEVHDLLRKIDVKTKKEARHRTKTKLVYPVE